MSTIGSTAITTSVAMLDVLHQKNRAKDPSYQGA
jgi:hypothetical protein